MSIPRLFLLSSVFCVSAAGGIVTVPQPTPVDGFSLTPTGLFSWKTGFPGVWTGYLYHTAQRPNFPAGPGTASVTITSGDTFGSAAFHPHSTSDQVAFVDGDYCYFDVSQPLPRPVRHRLANFLAPDAVAPLGGAVDESGAVTSAPGIFMWSGIVGGTARIFSRDSVTGIIRSGQVPSLPVKMARFRSYFPAGGRAETIVYLGNNRTLYQASPFLLSEAGSLLVSTELATDVNDFAWRDETSIGAGGGVSNRTRVFAARGPLGSPNRGQLLKIDLTAGGAVVTTNVTAGTDRQLTGVAVDQDRIYVRETPIYFDFFGEHFDWQASDILGREDSASGGGLVSPWTTVVDHTEGRHLQSDGTYLYWLSGGTIYRVETGAASPQLDYGVRGVELVQAVQSFTATSGFSGYEYLIAGKRTMLRVYPSERQNTMWVTPPRMTAKARAKRNGVPLPGEAWASNFPRVLPDSTPLSELRKSLDNSFQIEMPAEWVSQTGRLEVECEINPDHAAPETGDDWNANNRFTTSPIIYEARRPCLVFKPVWGQAGTYSPFDHGPNRFGLSTNFKLIVARAKSLMPVTDFELQFQPGALGVFNMVSDANGSRTFYTPFDFNKKGGTQLAFAALLRERADSGDPCPDSHWVGMVHPLEPWGFEATNGSFTAYPDASLAGWTTDPHAVLVQMNQRSNTPPIFGKTRADRADLDSFTSVAGGFHLAHELAHNYGMGHRDCGGASSGGGIQKVNSDPCTLGLGLNGNSPLESEVSAPFGFDFLTPSFPSPTAAVAAPGSTRDFMAYGGAQWVGSFTWAFLEQEIPVPQGAGNQAARSLGGGVGHPAIFRVDGIVNRQTERVERFDVRALPANSMDGTWANGSLAASLALGESAPMNVEVLGGTPPAVLARFGVAEEDAAEGGSAVGCFVQDVPWVAGTSIVRLVRDGQLLAESRASASPPTLTLNAPAVDEAGGTLALTWSASDADGDLLNFTVQFSGDGGTHWRTVGEVGSQLGITLDSALLPGGDNGCLRVLASDGFHTNIAVTGAISLPLHAPAVAISGADHRQAFVFGAEIRTSATAWDVEDGSLFDIQWTLSGPVSRSVSGPEATWGGLPSGEYALIASATDGDGLHGTATVSFTVLPPAIEESLTSVVVDGFCADEGYAASPPVRPGGTGRAARIHFARSGAGLCLCLAGASASGSGTSPSLWRIQIDPDGSGGAVPASGDLRVSIAETGTITLEHGDGIGGWVPSPGTEAATISLAVTRPDAGFWNAELCLPDGLLGGWNHAARMSFELSEVDPATLAATVTPWPTADSGAVPDSFSPVDLGPPSPVPNQAPEAFASSISPVAGGTVNVCLDGSLSFDADGDALAYHWTQTAGPQVTLKPTSNDSITTFDAPTVSEPTTLAFSLEVNDGALASLPAVVTISVFPPAAEMPAPSHGVWSLNTADGSSAVAIPWPGLVGDRVVAQTSTDLLLWDDLFETAVGNSLRIGIDHRPLTPAPSRFFRLRSADRDATPKPGNALSFDGTDGRVTVAHRDEFNAFPMTCSSQILTTAQDAFARGIAGKYEGGSENGWKLFLLDGRLRAFYFRDSANYVWQASGDFQGIDGGFVADGFWHHCTFVVDNSGGRLYVDGNLNGSMPWTGTPGPPSTPTALTFGKYDDAVSFLGQLDDLAYWNRALEDAEVIGSVLVSPSAGSFGLVSIWRFDEPDGVTTAGSSVSTAFSGTISGTVQRVPSTAPVYRP